jgi:hypothetical protein
VWLVAAEPGGSGGPRRVLAQVKNNLAPPQPSLAFEVAQGAEGVTGLNWVGPVALTADSLLARPRPGRPAQPRDAARAFLKEALAGGPLTSDELWERVEAEGLSVTTVQRAKKEVGIRNEWVMTDGRPVSYWLLGKQELPATVRPQTERDRWDIELRRALKSDPPSNPLDVDDP